MSDETTDTGSTLEFPTKSFHEWVLDRLGATLSLAEAYFVQDMLEEVAIPAKHDEILAAWQPVAKWAGFSVSVVEAKLMVEKAKAEEKARQKLEELRVKHAHPSAECEAVRTPPPSEGPRG